MRHLILPATINGLTTYFIGNYYELTGSTVTKYYYAGSQRVAMRAGSTLNFLLGDHLGSTSIVTDAIGNKVSEMRYKAWGEVRYNWGTTPTDYGFTGQYSHQSDFGLMFYNARYYDSALGRFASADTIVPGGVQGLDRYAYTNNSPLNFVDPTGHSSCVGSHFDDGPQCFVNGWQKYIHLPNPPSADSQDYGHRYATYETYIQVIKGLGYIPSTAELIAMTASSEYYPLIHRPDAGNLRVYAQEALARNFYEACGGEDTVCTDDQLYQFLSGYEPWWRVTGGATSSSRAQDILNRNNINPYVSELNQDVAQILDLNYVGDSTRNWTAGAVWNRPWQWRNEYTPPRQTGNFNSNVGAILNINLEVISKMVNWRSNPSWERANGSYRRTMGSGRTSIT